jgi:hypothetical protein
MGKILMDVDEETGKINLTIDDVNITDLSRGVTLLLGVILSKDDTFLEMLYINLQERVDNTLQGSMKE